MDPFTGERVVSWVDPYETLHFDQDCGSMVHGRQAVVDLDKVYLYRQCGTCLRPYRFTDRVERYAEAVELLQRAKTLLKDGVGSNGVQSLRTRQQAFALCRRAERIEGSGRYAGDVAKCANSIRKNAWAAEWEDVEGYLDWAGSMVVDPAEHFAELRDDDADRWRGKVEYARGELRRGSWENFEAAIGAGGAGTASYRSAVRAVRTGPAQTLVALRDGEEEGDLVLWVAGRHGVDKGGHWYALVPKWTVAVAKMLGADFEEIGEVAGGGPEIVEMYAELARARPGFETLQAAKRLVKARGGK